MSNVWSNLFNSLKGFPVLDYAVGLFTDTVEKTEGFISDPKNIRSVAKNVLTRQEREQVDYLEYGVKPRFDKLPKITGGLKDMQHIRFSDPRLQTSITNLVKNATNIDVTGFLKQYSGIIPPTVRGGRPNIRTHAGSIGIGTSSQRKTSKLASASDLGSPSKREVT